MMIETMGWSRGDASIAATIGGLVGGFLVPLAAYILNRIGVQKTLIIGLTMTLIGLFMLVTVTTKLWHWYVIYGLLLPIGRILCGAMPMQVSIMSWFNRKRAMVLGIVMTCAPIGGSIAQAIYPVVMKTSGRWQTGWWMSFGFIAIGLIMSFFIKGKPQDIGQHPDGIAPGEDVLKGKGTKTTGAHTFRTSDTWTTREVFKTPTMWYYIVVLLLNGLAMQMIIVHGALHLNDVGYSAVQAGAVLSFLTLASASSRFPMGWVGDRIEPQWIITGALCLMMGGFFGFWKAPSFGSLAVLAPMFGFSMGTILIMQPVILGNYYGPDAYASINGAIAPIRTVLVSGFAPVAGYIADKFGNYDSVFIALLIGLAVSIVCSAFLSPPEKPALKP
jgi:cyanate permease